MATIVVEDGTLVDGANSYIDDEYLTEYAADRDLTIPATEAERIVLILRAMDYIESQNFQGTKYQSDQSLQWPRNSVFLDGYAFGVDVIPESLKKALAQLVVEQAAGTILYPTPKTTPGEGNVIQSTVGPLTEKYSPVYGTISSVSPIRIASVDIFLRPLLCNSTRTIRV